MPTPTRTRNFGRRAMRDNQKFANPSAFIPGSRKRKTVIDQRGRTLEIWEWRGRGFATFFVYEPEKLEVRCVATADEVGNKFNAITANSSRDGAYGILINALISLGFDITTGADPEDGPQPGNQDPGKKNKK